MIDVSSESLVPIRDVPRLLPARPSGKRVHVSAVYRWVARGVRGVTLESIKIGGTSYTSMEALARFAEHLTGQVDKHARSTPTPKARQREIDRADQQVRALLDKQSQAGPHLAGDQKA